jgi:hypothetical protein
MNKPITSRIQHNSKGGMVREPLLNVGSVAKQLKDATKEGEQLSLNPNQSYVVMDNKIKIKTAGKPGTPGRTKLYSDLDPSEVEAAKAYNKKMFGTHNPTKEGKANNKIGGTKGTPDKFEDIPSSTPGTPGSPAQPEKRGDAFTSYQNRGQMRTNLSTNRVSKKTGRKELKEEKKQAKAGLKKATGANFFQRIFGGGDEGREYRQGVSDFKKGKFDSETLSKPGVSDFGYSADEATAKKKIALGEGYDANKGMKSIGDHIQKQLKQGIRGKSTSEQIATGGTNDNRVVTKKGKAAVAGTEGTNLDYMPATKKNKEALGMQMQRGYKQAPKSMAMKALIGNQKNLPEALKSKISAAPESSAKNFKKGYYGK